MIKLGVHTDNWRCLSGSFKTACEATVKNGIKHIEFAVIHGQNFLQAMGYDPAISLQSNPRALRRYIEKMGLAVSQIDGSYPMMGPRRLDLRRAIRPAVDPLRGGARLPDGRYGRRRIRDRRVFEGGSPSGSRATTTARCSPGPRTTRSSSTSEPHGPYTTDGDFMERLFSYFDSEYLRFNMDTGNSFISGLEPLDYLKRFRKYLTHAHIKDVSAGLAAAVRGEETGIAVSEVPVGGGVNAEKHQAVHRLPEGDRLQRRAVDRVLRVRREHPQQRRIPASVGRLRWSPRVESKGTVPRASVHYRVGARNGLWHRLGDRWQGYRLFSQWSQAARAR